MRPFASLPNTLSADLFTGLATVFAVAVLRPTPFSGTPDAFAEVAATFVFAVFAFVFVAASTVAAFAEVAAFAFTAVVLACFAETLAEVAVAFFYFFSLGYFCTCRC